MAWALSMGTTRSRESEFGRASSGPTSLRHRATGSKRTRQTRARPGRQTGCRTSHEFADRRDRQIGKMASYPFESESDAIRTDSNAVRLRASSVLWSQDACTDLSTSFQTRSSYRFVIRCSSQQMGTGRMRPKCDLVENSPRNKSTTVFVPMLYH